MSRFLGDLNLEHSGLFSFSPRWHDRRAAPAGGAGLATAVATNRTRVGAVVRASRSPRQHSLAAAGNCSSGTNAGFLRLQTVAMVARLSVKQMLASLHASLSRSVADSA